MHMRMCMYRSMASLTQLNPLHGVDCSGREVIEERLGGGANTGHPTNGNQEVVDQVHRDKVCHSILVAAHDAKQTLPYLRREGED